MRRENAIRPPLHGSLKIVWDGFCLPVISLFDMATKWIICPETNRSLCLEVKHNNQHNGGTIRLGMYKRGMEQMFEIYPAESCIISASSGLALDIGKDVRRGPNVIQWKWHSGSNQQWDYDGATHKLRSHFNQYVLDVQHGTVQAGATLVGAPETGSPSQRWIILKADDLRVEFQASGAPVMQNQRQAYDPRPAFARFGNSEGPARPNSAFDQCGCVNYPGAI